MPLWQRSPEPEDTEDTSAEDYCSDEDYRDVTPSNNKAMARGRSNHIPSAAPPNMDLTPDDAGEQSPLGPSHLDKLPEELITLITTYLRRDDVLRWRHTCRRFCHVLEKDFKAFMTEPRIQFSAYGFNLLFAISQSDFADRVKSIIFWATDYHELEHQRLSRPFRVPSRRSRLSRAQKARLQVLEQAAYDAELFRSTHELEDGLAAALAGLANLKAVTLDDSFGGKHDSGGWSARLGSAAMPFDTWKGQALGEALGRARVVLNRLSLADRRDAGVDFAYYPTMTRPAPTTDTGALRHIQELEMSFLEEYRSEFKYTKVLDLVRCAPNIKRLTLGADRVCCFLTGMPGVFPYLAQNVQLAKLEFLALRRMRISVGPLERLLQNHARTIVEVTITDCVVHGYGDVVEDMRAVVYQSVDKAHLAGNVRFKPEF